MDRQMIQRHRHYEWLTTTFQLEWYVALFFPGEADHVIPQGKLGKCDEVTGETGPKI